MDRTLWRAVRRVALRLLALILFVSLAYVAWGWFTLNRKLTALGPGGRVVSYELASPAEVPLKTSLPFAVRANVKQENAQNWLPTESTGLVEKRFAWSPGKMQWVEDSPAPLPMETRLQLEQLSKMPPPFLIDALADPDPLRREVAGRALRMETGQEFGYRFNGPPDRWAEASAAYRKWWETNKVRYSKEKLEKVLKGLEEPAR